MASGRPGAFLNPVTPKVNRVKELFFLMIRGTAPSPPPSPMRVAGMELVGVCLTRACEAERIGAKELPEEEIS